MSTDDLNYKPHPDYANLPEAVKGVFSPKEYAWLDDEGRRRLIEDMTLPEVEE